MDRVTISCNSCERLWTLRCTLSIYEQQSLESRPCPHCGACTLAVDKPEEAACTRSSRSWHAYAS